MTSVTKLVLTAGLLVCLGGCGVPEWWFGARAGALFQGIDGVSRPGQPVIARASLRGGRLMSALSDYTVLFYLDGRRIGAAKTDSEGLADIEHTFAEPGLHTIVATLDPAELGREDVPQCEILMGVYLPDTAFALIDLDKTLVAEGFDQVLLAEPPPMRGSQEALQWLSQNMTIIYLTHRPELLAHRTRQWLLQHGYPPGPLLVSTQDEFFNGSAAYKTGAVERLRQDFPSLRLGVGDRISDAAVYQRHGMKSFLIVQTENASVARLRELVTEMDALPETVQVVTDWSQVRRAVEGGQKFDRPIAQQRLRELAEQQEKEARP